jgi:hypothetical protein
MVKSSSLPTKNAGTLSGALFVSAADRLSGLRLILPAPPEQNQRAEAGREKRQPH